jgi:CO dehydrogenase maturation factor
VNATGRTVVADLEAGLGTLTRLSDDGVDVVVVVCEPTTKSLEVATRAAGFVTERDLGELIVVANRVRDDDDVERVNKALPGHEIVIVPDDPAIVAADRDGVAPLDAAPDAPAVAIMVDLANRIADGHLPVEAPA